MRLALALVLAALLPASASAATFTVSSAQDAVDASPGDGACEPCTLRAAVQEANATAGADTIRIPEGRYTLKLAPLPEAGSASDMDPANGDLDIDGEVTITGAGAGHTVIDGGGIDRVFETGATATAHLRDLTITHGDSTAGNSQEIDLGGGILNKGAITLDRVELVRNKADGGGGMFSIPGTMPVVRNSLIDRNSAFEGGGLRIDHGGHIVNTTITHNRLRTDNDLADKPVGVVIPAVDEISGYGGGIDHRGGADLTLEFSTITANHAVKGGGGIGAGQGYAPISGDLPLGRTILLGTIVAGNTSDKGPANCRSNQVPTITRGYNLASDATCSLSDKTDRPSTRPDLAALADYGGPLRTQALRRSSPAVDAGGPKCPKRDARGVRRPKGRACDIGAFERRRHER
jgi:CSLREA domain-containing protein